MVDKKARLKTIVRRIGYGMGVLCALVIVGWAIMLWTLFPHDVHNLRKYPKVRVEWSSWDKELVSHFPSAIPESASLTKFIYRPGFLQGGSMLQLRLGLPVDEVNALYERFHLKRTRSFFGGPRHKNMNETNGMPTAAFETGDKGQREFPADYEIMSFDPVPTNRTPGSWNHARIHGVAISTTRSEIVYWAEAW